MAQVLELPGNNVFSVQWVVLKLETLQRPQRNVNRLFVCLLLFFFSSFYFPLFFVTAATVRESITSRTTLVPPAAAAGGQVEHPWGDGRR